MELMVALDHKEQPVLQELPLQCLDLPVLREQPDRKEQQALPELVFLQQQYRVVD